MSTTTKVRSALLAMTPGKRTLRFPSSKKQQVKNEASAINTVRAFHGMPLVLRVSCVGYVVVRCERVEPK